MADSLGDNHLGNEQPEVDQTEDEHLAVEILEGLSEEEHSNGQPSDAEPSDDESDAELSEQEQTDPDSDGNDSSGEEDEEEEEEDEDWWESYDIGDSAEECDGSEDDDGDGSDNGSDEGFDFEGGDRYEDGSERTFHQFMNLPPEIRRMIWRFALPKGRVLRICSPDPSVDQWRLPREMFAPDILNPDRFATMPLAGVCRESRAFIKKYGYERLWGDRMNTHAEPFMGPWFCRGRDTFEVFTNGTLKRITNNGTAGHWLLD
ncbi:hypothetical protein ONZ43_g995 [Nemania bipapillata]|uniref:Uncharacterized protein n=1 Tax=Nemania bipapillata TaxID=110536 RepID=A0ACC2J6G5_9PEZI|nr:hypothetical protein ONZ43_g995 [Nemania bipapillata]